MNRYWHRLWIEARRALDRKRRHRPSVLYLWPVYRWPGLAPTDVIDDEVAYQRGPR